MGESRVGTGTAVVLFSDQVGSTASRARLGDISADELRRSHDRILHRCIEEGGGSIVKGTGDGVAATFESASAALQAAVAIQRAVERHNRRGESPEPISVRLGISAGDVTWEDDDFYGLPVVEAARLEAAAEADSILCSDVVRILAGSRAEVELEPVGALDLKGLPAPLTAWSVAWRTVTDDEAPPLPEALDREEAQAFVGRGSSLALLIDQYEQSRRDGISTALIAGEPGAGKSRLAREFARTVHGSGAIVLYARCDDGLGSPYRPFLQARRLIAGWGGHLAERLGEHPEVLHRIDPDLAAGDDHTVDLSPNDDTRRVRLYEAVLSWLEDLASDGPVVFVIDDLHWADVASLQLLRFIQRAASTAPVLVLCTYRDTGPDATRELETFLTEAVREERVVNVELAGLGVESVASLLADRSSPGLAQTLQELTGGNPFFVESVLRSTDLGSTSSLTVPRNVQDFIASRVSALPDPTVETLEVAAVIGAESEADLLVEVLGDESRLADLDAARDAHLIVEPPSLPVRYRFAHAIVRTTLYERIPATRRAALHHWIGRAIESRHAGHVSEQLDRLVVHFGRSGEPEDIDRVVRYGAEAGRVAMEQFAHDEAERYFAAVIEAMEQPSSTVTPRDRCAALVQLGVARRRSRHPETRETLLEAAEVAASLEDTELMVQAALANTRPVFWTKEATDPAVSFALERALHALPDDDSADRAMLLSSLSVERYLAGDDADHERLANEALAMADRIDDVAALAHVHHFRHLTMCRPDTVDERLQLALRMRTAVDATTRRSRFEYATWAMPCFDAAVEVGDLAQADEALAALTGISLELRDVNLAFNARLLQAARAAIAGRFDEADRLAEEMLELGNAAQQRTAPVFHIGLRFNISFHLGRLDEMVDMLGQSAEALPTVPILHLGHALALAESDRIAEARDALAPLADRDFANLPFDRDWLVSMVWAARVCWLTSDVVTARLVREMLLPYADQCANNITNWFGLVDGHIALLDHLLGDRASALARVERAATRHEALPAPALQATSLVDWATLLADAEADPDEIRRRATEGRRLANVYGLERLRARASALLAATD